MRKGGVMERIAVDLYQGLTDESIPLHGGGGFIFNARFATDSNYAIFETITFRNVRNIVMTDQGVTFYSDGNRVFVLYEPKNYVRRHIEPYLREDKERIPQRFSESLVYSLPGGDRLLFSRKPYFSRGSFTVENPEAGAIVQYFYDRPDAERHIATQLGEILHRDFGILQRDLRSPLMAFEAIARHIRTETEREAANAQAAQAVG